MNKWDLSNFDNKEDAHVGFQQVPENRTAVDNILRLNYNNQLRLTLMADTKANIMITVSSIVFSITVANITNEIHVRKIMDKRAKENIQRLKDLREIQLEYKRQKGYYL